MKQYIGILLIIICFLAACTPKYDAELSRAEQLMAEQPDSALAILQTIDGKTINNKYERARYALLYTKALDKNYLDHLNTNDSLISIATNYYRKRNNYFTTAIAYYYHARVLENAAKYSQAIKMGIEAEKHAANIEDISLKARIFALLGRLYAVQNFNDISIKNNQKALEYSIQLGETRYMLLLYQNLIIEYLAQKQYDITHNYISKAQQIAKTLNDTANILSLAQSEAALLMERDKDYRGAYNLLQYNYKKYNNEKPTEAHYFTLGEICIFLNMPDNAQYYLLSYNKNNTLTKREKANICYLLSEAIYYKHNYKQAYDNLHAYVLAADSLYYAEKKASLLEVSEKYQNEKLRYENHYQSKIFTYRIIFIICAALCVIIVALLRARKYYNKLKLQKVENIKQQELHNTISAEYIQAIEQNKNKHAETLELKMKFISKILDANLELKNLKKNSDALKTISATLGKQFDSVPQIICDEFNLMHNNITQILSAQPYSLTNDEITIYAMSYFKFSASHIAYCLNNITQQTIYNKHRIIRQKLNVSIEDEFSIIEEIMRHSVDS